MKLIHITDTHFVQPGRKLYGLDPCARLEAAISDINAHHGDAALAVITGDLTHWGEADAYQLFEKTLSQLKIPHIVLVGNHDKRATCLAHLKTAPHDPNGFVQGVRDLPVGRFVFLDTLNEASHAGQMCEKRLAWFEAALTATPHDQLLYLFMHHPPFKVGINDMDKISLVDSEAFFEVVKPYLPRVRHLFFGHVHRPICGNWHGISFSTLRGTNHQVWFDMREDCKHLASYEPPAYAVVLIEPEQIIVHTHDFLDDSPRFPFSKPGRDERDYQLGPIEPVN